MTQTTSFKTQGAFSPASHENAFDKLTMIVQQLANGSVSDADIATAVSDHESAADPHTGYFKLVGRSGGQTASGGTATTENLTLRANAANTNTGFVYIGSGATGAVYQASNGYVGILDTTPSYPLDVTGIARVTGQIWGGTGLFNTTLQVGTSTQSPIIYGSSSSGGDLLISSTSHGTKGNINFGSSSTNDEANERLGIGSNSPDISLEVDGQISGRRLVLYEDSATYTIDASKDCNGVFHSAALPVVVTLPDISATVSGCMVTLVNTDDTQSAAFSPHSSDSIFGRCASVADGTMTTLSGTANKDVQNTAGNSEMGDSITVVAMNTAKQPGWYVISCTGVWTSEP
jgi:hypothetical protein